MSTVERLSQLAEDHEITFKHDGEVWVVVEASEESLYAKIKGREDDPYAGEDFEWADLNFTASELLARNGL